MHVKFKCDIDGHKPGSVVDVPEDLAKQYQVLGAAEAITADPQPAVPAHEPFRLGDAKCDVVAIGHVQMLANQGGHKAGEVVALSDDDAMAYVGKGWAKRVPAIAPGLAAAPKGGAVDLSPHVAPASAEKPAPRAAASVGDAENPHGKAK